MIRRLTLTLALFSVFSAVAALAFASVHLCMYRCGQVDLTLKQCMSICGLDP
jgi:hypothetical protein